MVDKTALGEECEGVKELEDGVARLVDRHHHNTIPILYQTIRQCKLLTIVHCMLSYRAAFECLLLLLLFTPRNGFNTYVLG